jgi:hypothetical protein
MPNEWKVILRAGDTLDLSQSEKEDYVNLASEIYADKVSEAPPSGNSEKFDQFLNEEVFSDSRLVEFVSNQGASSDLVSQFKNGEIKIENLVEKWHQIQFSLDELIDLVMMLKLIRDYSHASPAGRIDSRYRFQKLIYKVNLEIKKKDRISPLREFEEELGMLDRTGYRYHFFKRNTGPYSELVYEDKNRLFAWSLIDEPIIGSEGTGEVAEQNRRYGIELSAQGEILMEQFYDKIEESNSLMVSSWNVSQKDAIQDIAGKDYSEIKETFTDAAYSDKEVGDKLLSGPDRKFKKNDVRFLGQLAERMDTMTSTQQFSGGVA